MCGGRADGAVGPGRGGDGVGRSRHADVPFSALTGEGMDVLLATIDGALRSDPIVDAELRVPQHEGAALGHREAGMIVNAREYEGNLVRLNVSGPASLVGQMRRFRQRSK